VRIVKWVDEALAVFETSDLECAMVHAGNAVDGTARETYGHTMVFR
jgi:hypothetical protein